MFSCVCYYKRWIRLYRFLGNAPETEPHKFRLPVIATSNTRIRSSAAWNMRVIVFLGRPDATRRTQLTRRSGERNPGCNLSRDDKEPWRPGVSKKVLPSSEPTCPSYSQFTFLDIASDSDLPAGLWRMFDTYKTLVIVIPNEPQG